MYLYFVICTITETSLDSLEYLEKTGIQSFVSHLYLWSPENHQVTLFAQKKTLHQLQGEQRFKPKLSRC